MKKYTWFFLSAILLIVSCKDSAPEAKTDAPKQMSETAKSIPPVKTVTSSNDHNKTGDLNWHSASDVEELLKKDKKMILVDVYTKWCGPCKMMDARTFTNADVQKAINDKFHPVKFDAEGPDPLNFKNKTWSNPNHDATKTRGRNAVHELASFFSVRGYPSLVVLDENYNIIKKIVGFKTPDQLLAEIAAI